MADDNLYIGTSASEILHLVLLPPASDIEPAQYILASRLQPGGHDAAQALQTPGVQQIVVLPGVLKACVLCNGTASFYSLPELSPAFPNREPTGVQWIGGIDGNQGRENPDGTTLMIGTQKRILQVRVADRLRPVRPNIEYPECVQSSRRDTIACVADGKSYALLEIEQQQKIPLFDISTAPDPSELPSNQPSPSPSQGSGHIRSTSLVAFSPSTSDPKTSPDKNALGPSPAGNRSSSPSLTNSESRPSSRPRSSTAGTSPATSQASSKPARKLKPHVISPSPNEFMLTTGTTFAEPGVGMFVNLDGEVSRGTIEFDQYPEDVIAYTSFDPNIPANDIEEAQFVIALLEKSAFGRPVKGLQILSLATDDDSSSSKKTWLPIPEDADGIGGDCSGIHRSLSSQRHYFADVVDLLVAVRYRPNRRTVRHDSDLWTKPSIEKPEQESAFFNIHSTESTSPTPEYEKKRAAEELKLVERLGHSATYALVWSSGSLWQLLPNPLLLQLEAEMLKTVDFREQTYDFARVNVSQVISFLGSVRRREPRDEAEVWSIKYARQKASIILFLHLLTAIRGNENPQATCKLTENALQEGGLDPRILMLMLPPLSHEVLQGTTGIWIHQGIVDCLSDYESPVNAFSDAPIYFWLMFRHFLSSWQEKRGFGSISDEKFVFDSVDAALLHLLLYLDKAIPKGDGAHTPVRVKLHNVVDHWRGDFDRAIALLEHYKRLYILSRLYQSRKSAKDVLHIWKRICEGEENMDEDITIDHVLNQMRMYLTKIRDPALVREFSIWLAQKSPEVAVQLLSDENSRVKFPPSDVVPMLKTHAPNSVQLFLEHLVFAKSLDQYADDLVGYYLDSVLSVLEQSEQARQSLADSYTTYRALTSPKPTYLNFIRENAPDQPWWQSRLRLLQLLGSGGYATATGSTKSLTYSIDMVLDRLRPFSNYLVSESIILDARQGRHNEALKLLVHGLGDYDTAVRYCYFGGPSTPSETIDASLLPSREQQSQQFTFLFREFMHIPDDDERMERTSHLLGTFATWFDPLIVLDDIPASWSVSQVSEFLLRTFRAATTERNQAVLIKALSAAQNLQRQAEFIELCEKIGSKLELGGDASNDASAGAGATSTTGAGEDPPRRGSEGITIS